MEMHVPLTQCRMLLFGEEKWNPFMGPSLWHHRKPGACIFITITNVKDLQGSCKGWYDWLIAKTPVYMIEVDVIYIKMLRLKQQMTWYNHEGWPNGLGFPLSSIWPGFLYLSCVSGGGFFSCVYRYITLPCRSSIPHQSSQYFVIQSPLLPNNNNNNNQVCSALMTHWSGTSP